MYGFVSDRQSYVGFARPRRSYKHKIEYLVNPFQLCQGVKLLSGYPFLKTRIEFIKALVCRQSCLLYSFSLRLFVP